MATASPQSNESIQTEFAVDMTCDACKSSVENALSSLQINSVSIDVPNKKVVVESPEAPSKLLSRLRSTGMSVILRGIASESAVCIFDSGVRPVGVARLVQVRPEICLVDVSVDNDITPYDLAIHSYGDISNLPDSIGQKDHDFGRIETAQHAFEQPQTKLYELIGKSMCIRNRKTNELVCGIIARSAGVFENSKVICACSGKTLWEENRETNVKQ